MFEHHGSRTSNTVVTLAPRSVSLRYVASWIVSSTSTNVISIDGGATFTYPIATFSDGTSQVTITFNPSNYSVFPIDYLGSIAQYKTLRAEEIVSIMNSEFTSNNINKISSSIEFLV